MSRAADDYDSLASAFLGGPSRERSRQPSVGLPSLLVVGNVPTLAGIWIAQFADHHARTAGPVALVRLDGSASRGELFRGQGRALPSDPAQWLERASAITRNWILCVDSQVDASSIALAGCPISFLSGTDEAALAAMMRSIEAIDAAAVGGGIKSLKVGLAMVGSPEETAKIAAQKVTRWASEHCLVTQVSMAMHAQRVDRVESTGPVPLSMFSELDVPSAAEYIGIAIEGSSMRMGTPRAIEPMAAAAVTPVTPATPAPPRMVESAPRAAAPVASNSLIADFFPELVSIPFSCPQCKDVVLASDASGALHLIRAGSEASGLRIASAWARGNWNLLCAAVSALNLEGARIVEHLLLEDAKAAASLHRTGLLLHAKVEIRAGGMLIRQRIDLNDEQSAAAE